MEKQCEQLTEHKLNEEQAFQMLIDEIGKLDKQLHEISGKLDELLVKKRAYNYV